MKPENPNTAGTYLSQVEQQYPHETYRFWDVVHYDALGDLRFGEVRIKDVVQGVGTPVRITMPEIATKRAKQWETISKDVAQEVGYNGSLDYFYATKASPTSFITTAAMAAGWNIETSSEQDLFNLLEMEKNHDFRELLDSHRIICNGYKPHPSRYNRPDVSSPLPSTVTFTGELKQVRRGGGDSYAEMIVTLKQRGMDISPIIDSIDELDYFNQPDAIPSMTMGLRLKSYGLPKVLDQQQPLEALVSRHGMDQKTIFEAADRIIKAGHHQLTMFHSMVGAAESIEPEKMVKSLLMAGNVFFQLRQKFPQLQDQLRSFNIGGGIPPLGFGYDHQKLLRHLYSGMKQLAAEYGQDEPTLVFELGSMVAAEAGMYVTGITSEKINDATKVPWGLVDGSVMRSVIDMILIGKNDYVILAGNHADKQGKMMRLGDRTCDSDGYVRTKENNQVLVPDPNGDEPDYGNDVLIAVLGTEAYERTLTGYQGVGHCGLAEPIDVTIYHDASGKPVCMVDQQKTEKEALRALGYGGEFTPILQALLGLKK